MKNAIARSVKITFGLLAVLSMSVSAFATETVNITEYDSTFEDIRLEIENAIIEKGFVIDFNGNISGMLENTANVADNATPVFSNAEFWQFCSSKVTRQLTNADPANIAYCPFVIFAYETMDDLGTVTIGYRPLPKDISKETNDIVKEVNSMLESIVVKAGL